MFVRGVCQLPFLFTFLELGPPRRDFDFAHIKSGQSDIVAVEKRNESINLIESMHNFRLDVDSQLPYQRTEKPFEALMLS